MQASKHIPTEHQRGMAPAHGRGPGFEFWSKRLGNWLCSGDGKYEKIRAHRLERRAAERDIRRQLGEA